MVGSNFGALEELAGLENVTNERLQAQDSGLPAPDPRELVFGRAGYTFINAAFTHTRPGGNRFNDENRGAWSCGFTVETSLGEVSYHLTRELEAIERFENVTDYAELLADFHGPVHDLRTVDRSSEPVLSDDTRVAYPAGQTLANRLRNEAASNGIVYPSARYASGVCLAASGPTSCKISGRETYGVSNGKARQRRQ